MCNGASPLVLDNARHNSALHWAASCCRADCVVRLLGSGATFQMQSGQLVAIAGGSALPNAVYCSGTARWVCEQICNPTMQQCVLVGVSTLADCLIG